MDVTSETFREAMSRYATGVCVVTCLGADGRTGLGITVNSFTSVSLDPPLVLWCLDKKTDRYPPFAAAKGYAVNILGHDQDGLSIRFAERGDLDGLHTQHWVTGAPILSGTLAAMDCTVVDRHDAGDHVILIGRVERLASFGETPDPLVYFKGGYRRITG